MLVELWPIERVKPYERNPRVNDSAVDAIAASLREFGWRQPIVVDGEGVIIVGHTRWKAAKKLGEEAIETVIAAIHEDDKHLAGEAADLLYHLLVVLHARGISLAQVEAVLAERQRQSGLVEKASRPQS